MLSRAKNCKLLWAKVFLARGVSDTGAKHHIIWQKSGGILGARYSNRVSIRKSQFVLAYNNWSKEILSLKGR